MSRPTDEELEAAGLDDRKYTHLVEVVHRGDEAEANATVAALAKVRASYQNGENE